MDLRADHTEYIYGRGRDSAEYRYYRDRVKERKVKIEKLRQENKELQDTMERQKSSRRDLPEPKDVSSINLNASSQQKLIPVKDFLLTHLPPCYQHVEMLSLIRSLVDITVKIEVNGVGRERKQFWDGVQTSVLTSKSLDTMDVPGSAEGNPKNASTRKTENTFHEFSILHSKGDVKDFTGTSDGIRLSDVVLGSGKVDDVFIRTDGPCPCHKKCQEWGEIRVLTSAQLMYDDDDAKHFVCTFFYDDDDKRMDQQKSARGDRIVLRDLKKDVCMFLCVTCDVELVRTLEGMLDKFEQSWENAFDKYANTVKWENEKLTVIVSHPNGLRKHISLGKSLTPNVESSDKRLQYETPTCKGSTGAYVLIPDFDVHDDV
ncbi:uncharacterized protein LOC129923440 isoform X2 [Biomphalaria glabrata]|uniref:Uncharacterized protein LOC129923440 isoform X2 n=1 Tax=Biomphalaria glabrata TaxID=6526 RepID=A0A9W2Z5X8_BIOGL|nr:uncharacterized protein LOC129923440 isoform X2 [Biomphalaria glabrata]